RVGTGGVADEQGRVAHQLAAADHLVEGTPPGSTEVDVVVRDAPVPLGRSHVQHRRGRRVAQPAHPAGCRGQQVAVGDREIGVEHDDVGGDAFAVGGDHARGPVGASVHIGHPGAVPELHAVLLRGTGQCPGYRVDAAAREVDAGDRVEVGDD